MAGFQEAIRAAYPVFRQEEAREVTMSPTGEIHAAPQHVWRFADVREECTIAVGTAFIATPISAAARAERMPPPPAVLLGAIQDPIRTEPLALIRGKSLKPDR